MSRTVIFANGQLPDASAARQLLEPNDIIVAANGGMKHITRLGLQPSIIIGDQDSLDSESKKIIEENHIRVVAHPEEKNETDLEAALGLVFQEGYKQILIVAALGGRLDQLLANLSLLGDPALLGCEIRMDDGVEEVVMMKEDDQYEIHGKAGDIVSLLPWGNVAGGVTTRNLKWTLTDESLYPYKTRGISNVMLEEKAWVHIRSGQLLVVHRREL